MQVDSTAARGLHKASSIIQGGRYTGFLTTREARPTLLFVGAFKDAGPVMRVTKGPSVYVEDVLLKAFLWVIGVIAETATGDSNAPRLCQHCQARHRDLRTVYRADGLGGSQNVCLVASARPRSSTLA